MNGRGKRDQPEWTGSFSDDPASHAPAWIVAMLTASPRNVRILRRFADSISAAPDLKVDFTEGRGCRRRNVRLRVTGPEFAVRVVSAQLKALFGVEDSPQ